MRISDWSSDVCSSDLLSETEYRDMLELHLILLLAALATTPRGRAAPDPQDGDYPDRTAGLFIEMAARSGNGELVASITALGDRLHLARPPDEQLDGETAADKQGRASGRERGGAEGKIT